MATRFELVLHGRNEGFLRAVGEEALDEITRIEAMLSLYKPSSEVANVNGRAGVEAVRVSAELFSLLEKAVALWRRTDGAFDITIAPLVRCWGFMQGQGAVPEEAAIAAARACIGSQWLELDAATGTARFARPGMMLDFGAFGKGHAVDSAIAILREAGVESALLHGGTSTVFALGRQPDGTPWKVAVENGPPGDPGHPPDTVAVLALENESLSVSAIWGKSFASQGRTFGHILDARTGQPGRRAELAAVTLPSAAESDAISTALLVDGPAALAALAANRPNARALVVTEGRCHFQNLDATRA